MLYNYCTVSTRELDFFFTLYISLLYSFTLTNVKTPYRDNPVETLDLKVFEVMYNNFRQRWGMIGKQLTHAYEKKKSNNNLAPVVQKTDSGIHWRNLYPM